MKLKQEEVLVYKKGRRSQSTVRRHYYEWRSQQKPPIPERCDNPNCAFFSNPLIWNGKPLPLRLDHINGVSGDNRPKNLQLICPNCDSQLTTQGGKNKGRVEQSKGGFAIKRKDGLKDYTLPAEPSKLKLSG